MKDEDFKQFMPGNSFWLASGAWKNWEHTINNPPIRWGAKERERNLWDKLDIGDIVFCSASSKTERLFKKNGIFMVGKITRKFNLEKNDGYYPGSETDSTDFFRYRFELEPLKIVKNDAELLPIVDGLVFRKSINRITNPSVIGKLSENLEKYWNIKIGSQDKIEKLIYEFDRNRNYFASDRTLKKDETFKYRDEFLAKFPINKISDMKLDDYVIGKPDETTGEPRRDTFSYYLEKSLKAFGRISGRWSRFHGIYWNKEKNEYVWNGEFNNQNEAFEAIKSQIFSMLKAAQVLEKDGDWNEFAEFMSTQRKTVMANIKNKILCVYFPNLFLTLHKKQLLDDVLDEFHIKFNRKESRYLKEKKILDVKTSHPTMKNWDNLDLSYFLWKAILSGDEDIDSGDAGDFDEDVVSENNYLLLRHSAKKENKWRDDIGKQYHFGRIPNYTKLIPGSKTIWYDRDEGDFYYWGYGDISKTEKESEDHIHAYFDKFTYFNKPSKESPTTDDVVPEKGDEQVQQQIMNLPGWNNQISMLPITKDIYDAIVNAKKLSEEDLGVKMIENLKSKNIDYLTPEDFEEFLNAVPKLEVFNQPGQKPPMNAEQFQLLFRILYGSALKILDALNIRVKDLDLDNRIIRIGDSTSKFPYATILPTDVSYLKEYVSTLQKDDNLFDVHRATLWRYAKQIGDLAGLKIFRGKEERETEGMDLLIFRESRAMHMSLDGTGDGLIRRKLRVDFSNAVLRYDQPTIEDLKEWELKNSGKSLDMIPQFETFDDKSLSTITNAELKSGIEKIQQELLIDSDTIREIVVNLVSGRHVLLAGPVGTGKTQLAILIPRAFWAKNGGYYSEVHTATADWSTQDVIGGIVPKMVGEDVKYEIQHGCVTETILENWDSKACQNRRKSQHEGNIFNGTWLVIDEFNRADIDKAFGPLFTSVETRYLKIPSDKESQSHVEIKIPKDYRIIGTLNTADKHYLFRLSDALKRRFAYIEVNPPLRSQKDNEIFYALKNAIRDLPPDEKFKWISLNESEKVIDENNSDKEFVTFLKTAYDVLDFIRVSKPLGTAVLKSIYQTFLTGSKLTEDFNKSIDLSLNTNLIPQLENVQPTTLETIVEFFDGDVVEFFKRQQDSPIRERYTNDFKMILRYMEVKNLGNKVDKFSKGELKEEDVWNTIRDKIVKSKLEVRLPIFTKSIRELVKSSSMI